MIRGLRRFVVPLIGVAIAFGAGYWVRSGQGGRGGAPGGGGDRGATTSPSLGGDAIATAVRNLKAEDYVSALDHEFIANRMQFAWVAVDGGAYAAGYFAGGDGPITVLYLFDEMSAKSKLFPAVGPVSGESTIEPDDLAGVTVVRRRAPVRYVKQPDGGFSIGFFEPARGVFFRWRGQVRQAEQINFDPEHDAVSPEVRAERVTITVDVDPPKDMRSREPI